MRSAMLLACLLAVSALRTPLRTPPRSHQRALLRLCAEPEPSTDKGDAAETAEPAAAPAAPATENEPETVVLFGGGRGGGSPFGDKTSPIWQKPKPVEQGPDNTPEALKIVLDYLWVPFVVVGIASVLFGR